LLGLDVHMGAVTVRDTATDADTVSVYARGSPSIGRQRPARSLYGTQSRNMQADPMRRGTSAASSAQTTELGPA
jgi:hypothetical protein